MNTQGTAPRFSQQDVTAALGEAAQYLGSGTFGDTWRAGNQAVKIICVDNYPRERLEREVEGLTRVRSPQVVALIGTDEILLGGKLRPILRFEYIEGGDVDKKVQEKNLLPASEVSHFLRGLLLGVKALHETSTIHRDIKPGNIALRSGEWSSPVLLDLGLAKQLDGTSITVYPGFIGTARYMAPEQLRAQRARKAADLWSVGVTVREVLTGSHPFYVDGQNYSVDEAIRKLSDGPSAVGVDIPDGVREVLDRLTAFEEFERGSVSSNLTRLDRAGV